MNPLDQPVHIGAQRHDLSSARWILVDWKLRYRISHQRGAIPRRRTIDDNSPVVEAQREPTFAPTPGGPLALLGVIPALDHVEPLEIGVYGLLQGWERQAWNWMGKVFWWVSIDPRPPPEQDDQFIRSDQSHVGQGRPNLMLRGTPGQVLPHLRPGTFPAELLELVQQFLQQLRARAHQHRTLRQKLKLAHDDPFPRCRHHQAEDTSGSAAPSTHAVSPAQWAYGNRIRVAS